VLECGPIVSRSHPSGDGLPAAGSSPRSSGAGETYSTDGLEWLSTYVIVGVNTSVDAPQPMGSDDWDDLMCALQSESRYRRFGVSGLIRYVDYAASRVVVSEAP
jgi:hypothetical protein